MPVFVLFENMLYVLEYITTYFMYVSFLKVITIWESDQYPFSIFFVVYAYERSD